MKVKTVLLYKFRCPECGTEVLVANCKDEASVICAKCGVWMRWMNGYKRKICDGTDVHAGDKAFPEEEFERR